MSGQQISQNFITHNTKQGLLQVRIEEGVNEYIGNVLCEKNIVEKLNLQNRNLSQQNMLIKVSHASPSTRHAMLGLEIQKGTHFSKAF